MIVNNERREDMTFEKYLKENCGQRILDCLANGNSESRDFTLPGRILDDESFNLGNGIFCQPAALDVERVYYRPCDMGYAEPEYPADEAAAEQEAVDAVARHDLSFIVFFSVQFLTFRIGEDCVSEPAKAARKYYASCTADIDDGMLRNFRMTDIHDRNLMAELDIEMLRKQGDLSRFPVRAMTEEDLERRADAFLDRFCPEAKEEPMRVPVRTIFRMEFGIKPECGGDENRFTMARECCRHLWDASAIKLLELLDEKDGNPPFPEAMRRIMDRNAKRTAAAILMPAATLKQLVRGFCGAYEEEQRGAGAGDHLKCMIYDLADEYGVSVQAMKIRLEDLGFSMFSGVLNHLDGEYVPAFTTSEDNPGKCGRYLIGMGQLKEMLSERPELLKLCEQEEFVYIEGKLVLNRCRYVQEVAGERTMTPYARAHVDECCIRFRGTPGRGRRPAGGSAAIYDPGRNCRFRRGRMG